MGKYLALRLLNYVVLLFVAVSLAFFLASASLNPAATYQLTNPPLDPVSIQNILRQYNLSRDIPIWQRYWTWLSDIVTQWNWGTDPRGLPIAPEVARRIGVSLRLMILGTVIGIVIGVAAGAWSASRQYKARDRVVTFVSLLFLSTPTFVTATILVILATKANLAMGLQLFEFTGETGTVGTYPGAWLVDRAQHLLLPTLVLVIVNFAFFSRIQRNLMLDAMGSDYVRTARAKGLRLQKAIMKHALRTSLIPTGTYFAFSVATIFVGATVTETVFSFNGMGSYTVKTIQSNDVYGTLAVTAFTGVCVLVGAMLSDVMVAVLDPRVRLS